MPEPTIVTPAAIIRELRRIADGLTDDPPHIQVQRIAALLAEWMESERLLRQRASR